MNHRIIKQFLTTIVVVIALIAVYKWLLAPYISLDQARLHEQAIQQFIAHHYWESLALFMGFYILVVFCMLPITLVLNIAAGYFYGVVIATGACIVSAALGALLSMIVFRYCLTGLAEKMYGTRLNTFRDNFKANGVSYILALQLLPVTPFPLITAAAALSGISWWAFFGTTLVGITPGTIIYTFAGRSFATIKESDSLLSWQLIVLLCLLSLLALLPSVVRYYLKKRKKS